MVKCLCYGLKTLQYILHFCFVRFLRDCSVYSSQKCISASLVDAEGLPFTTRLDANIEDGAQISTDFPLSDLA